VLGELASQTQQWMTPVQHFSRAGQVRSWVRRRVSGAGRGIDFGEKIRRRHQALETAVKIEPGNPTAHYSLATAYSRAGRKPEADREFAVHKQLTKTRVRTGDASHNAAGDAAVERAMERSGKTASDSSTGDFGLRAAHFLRGLAQSLQSPAFALRGRSAGPR